MTSKGLLPVTSDDAMLHRLRALSIAQVGTPIQTFDQVVLLWAYRALSDRRRGRAPHFSDVQIQEAYVANGESSKRTAEALCLHPSTIWRWKKRTESVR